MCVCIHGVPGGGTLKGTPNFSPPRDVVSWRIRHEYISRSTRAQRCGNECPLACPEVRGTVVVPVVYLNPKP